MPPTLLDIAVRVEGYAPYHRWDVKIPVAGLAATDSVAPAGPHLQFMAALDRAGLRANCRHIQECSKDEGRENSTHRCVSSGIFDSSHRGIGAEKI